MYQSKISEYFNQFPYVLECKRTFTKGHLKGLTAPLYIGCFKLQDGPQAVDKYNELSGRNGYTVEAKRWHDQRPEAEKKAEAEKVQRYLDQAEARTSDALKRQTGYGF